MALDRGWQWLLLASLAACAGSTAPAAQTGDAGGPDAGLVADAGSTSDAGRASDAGVDAGTGSDAGCAQGVMPQPGDVMTQSGLVRGTSDGGVARYLGIPYTAPRLGGNRWRLPEKLGCFAGGLKVATQFGPECPQYTADGGLTGAEDCLTLNVWAPAGAATGSKPVLFFVHGGAHEEGSSSMPKFDGAPLASNEGALVVTFEYRVGPFGFLAHPALSAEGGTAKSGNYGLHDQIAALQWVHDNIAAFGGDPSRVLLFGESAGAESVCQLVVSPLANGLFASALMESGGCAAMTLSAAEQKGVTLANNVGCTDEANAPSCLRGLTTAQVMAGFTPAANGTTSVGQKNFDAVIDGYALPSAPLSMIDAGTFAQVPIVLTSNTEESGKDTPAITDETQFRAFLAAFLGIQTSSTIIDQVETQYPIASYGNSWRTAAVAATTDAKFTCSARKAARLFADRSSAAVYRGWFGDVPDNASAQTKAFGAFHGSDLLYVFGTLSTLYPSTEGSGDLATIAAMQDFWSSLAATGTPTSASAPTWPVYVSSNEQLMFFRNGAQVLTSDPRGANCDFWDGIVL